jgi:four helix bundle protein
MSDINTFEDLDAWQKARTIVNTLYTFTRENDFDNDYSLIEQMRDAAVSIMSNIAEGFGRDTTEEFIRFLYIAKGSAAEVQSQLYAALDQDYIKQEQFDHLYDQLDHNSRQLQNLITYLKKQK